VQWHITWADNFTTARHIFFWDVDSIPVMPLRYHHFFDADGKPFWFFWSTKLTLWIKTDNAVVNTSTSLGVGSRDAYKRIMENAKMDFMVFFPVVIPRTGFKYMRDMVVAANPTAKCFDEAWVQTKRPSHIDLIGKAMLTRDPNLIHVISCPSQNTPRELNECADVYRTVEHAKHPVQGAHDTRSHLSARLGHLHVEALMKNGLAASRGAELPSQMWHYDLSRSSKELDTLRRWLFGD